MIRGVVNEENSLALPDLPLDFEPAGNLTNTTGEHARASTTEFSTDLIRRSA